MKHPFFLGFALLVLGLPGRAGATEPASDCVIRTHNAVWALRVDGAAEVEERLAVDCGDLPDKHGIFRTLPAKVPRDTREQNVRRETPVRLVSITDEAGNPYHYSTTHEGDTVTWKIGDPDRTISGVNNYQIRYIIENAVWPRSDGQYQLDLNIVGQFWQLPIDHSSVRVVLPNSLPADTSLSVTTGGFGSTTPAEATVTRPSGQEIKIDYGTTLQPEEGLTLSFRSGPGSFSPANPYYTAWERYGALVWLVWPLLAGFFLWRIWFKHGRDARVNKAHMVQYEPPADLLPLELYQLQHNGQIAGQAVTATIIGLAVKGFIKIEQTEKKILGLGSKETLLTLVKTPTDPALSGVEQEVMRALFPGGSAGDQRHLSDLKNKFYQSLPDITQAGKSRLIEKGLFEDGSPKLYVWLGVAVVVLAVSFAALGVMGLLAWLAPLTAGAVLIAVILFLILMPRRTAAGAEIEWQLRGFQDFLKTAEQHRLKFSEQENLFEKYLPYAAAFGLVTQWVSAMRKIYGEEHFARYHPAWYVGSWDTFNIDSFTADMQAVTKDISSAITSSPSGGGGSSGGGAGGGGGGSW